MNSDWPLQIALALLTGRSGPVVLEHLDPLLVWLGNPDNPRVAVLDEAIARRGLARALAGDRAYALLDQLLFAGPPGQPARILGLGDATDPAAVRRRYRHLIHAYHPDRQPQRGAQLNGRLEAINLAYAALTEWPHHTAVSHDPAQPIPMRSRVHARRHRPRRAPRSLPFIVERIRQALGSAARFEQRFFTGLVLICALILAALLFQSAPPPQGAQPLQGAAPIQDASPYPAPGAMMEPGSPSVWALPGNPPAPGRPPISRGGTP